MSLKFTEELCIMTIKSDAKFEDELTCCFRIDMRNLAIFHSKVSKFCTLTFELKNAMELCLMTMKSDAEFEEKLTCALENDMRNIANAYQNT